MAKFNVGDIVQWNDGKHYHDDKRIDIITEVVSDVFGGTRYYTKEINNKPNEKPKVGLAYEDYLVYAPSNKILKLQQGQGGWFKESKRHSEARIKGLRGKYAR